VQTLVLFVIRTTGNPFHSRPSGPLIATTLSIVAVGALLPIGPVPRVLGFAVLPIGCFGFLVCATLAYLLFVEIAKRRVVRLPA
jgi:Mg2+-importing ATPase